MIHLNKETVYQTSKLSNIKNQFFYAHVKLIFLEVQWENETVRHLRVFFAIMSQYYENLHLMPWQLDKKGLV